jgi:hypothetical protein
MRSKVRNKIMLVCWFATAAALIVIYADNRPSPPAAQASITAPMILPTPGTPQIAAPNTSQLCRPVIDQIVRIAKSESARACTNDAQALAVIDQCVKQEEQIDTRACPADFRNAVSRFVIAEWTLSRDAHRDSWSNPQIVRRAFFDVYNHKSPYDSLDQISDRMKRDIDVFQSATFDLIQVADSFGVN